MEWIRGYLSYNEGYTVWGVPVVSFIYSALILFCVLGLKGTLLKKIFSLIRNETKKINLGDDGHILRGIRKGTNRLTLLLGCYCATLPFRFGPTTQLWIHHTVVSLTLLAVYISIAYILKGIASALIQAKGAQNKAMLSFIPLAHKCLLILIGIVCVVSLLSEFGYKATTLISALGLGSALGGAAVAFASKDTIANLLASISLTLSRPFNVGDVIGIGGKYEGRVEEIGLRSTLLRTFEKTLLTIPNSYIANEIVNNFSQRSQRHVRHSIGITYDATPEQIEKLISDLKTLINSDAEVEPESHLIVLEKFGDSSLDILVQYFTKNIDQAGHYYTVHRINIGILNTIAAHELSMAFPTRTIYMAKS